MSNHTQSPNTQIFNLHNCVYKYVINSWFKEYKYQLLTTYIYSYILNWMFTYAKNWVNNINIVIIKTVSN